MEASIAHDENHGKQENEISQETVNKFPVAGDFFQESFSPSVFKRRKRREDRIWIFSLPKSPV